MMQRFTKRLPDGAVTVTGNTQEIFAALANYEDAQEQGRLIILPCKTGDTVYDPIVFGSIGIERIIGGMVEDIIPLSSIGKNVFLTRELAEEALKEMRKGEQACT